MPQKNISRNFVLTLAIATSLITPFIGAAVNLALPKISADLKLGTVTMSWVAMSYILSSAVFLVPIGKLADITGRKKIFLWGNIVLACSSALCLWAPNGELLIIFRIFQGLGSAMVFATGIALLTSVFPPQERGKAIGVNVTAVYIGLSAAPLLGGLMITHLGWRSLFYAPIAIGFLAALGAKFGIQAEWAEAQNEHFDLLGTLVYIPAMSLFMFGFSKLPAPTAIVLTAAGLLGLLIFIRIELFAASPVLNISLFLTNKLFAFANLAALINYAVTFAVTFMLSLFLQTVKGLSPREAGFILAAQPAAMALVASWSGKMSDRYDPRIFTSAGMAVSAIGLFLLAFVDQKTSSAFLIATLILLGLGFGLFSSPNTNSIMGSVEKKFLGLASGMVGTMRLTGQMASMGIAALVLHIFIGDVPLKAANPFRFVAAVQTTFFVFVALSCVGVWASLKRGKLITGQT